ncbi:MAG: hypothetical protein H6675_06250 [Dehalococcoidia bacterium]|nr:hypothetical protein [Dehalococcoidia bacterium]
MTQKPGGVEDVEMRRRTCVIGWRRRGATYPARQRHVGRRPRWTRHPATRRLATLVEGGLGMPLTQFALGADDLALVRVRPAR